MSRTITLAAVILAVLTLVYGAVSCWVVTLPLALPALGVCVVAMLTAYYTFQLVTVPAMHRAPLDSNG